MHEYLYSKEERNQQNLNHLRFLAICLELKHFTHVEQLGSISLRFLSYSLLITTMETIHRYECC